MKKYIISYEYFYGDNYHKNTDIRSAENVEKLLLNLQKEIGKPTYVTYIYEYEI